MKRIYFVLAVALTAFLASCSKEDDGAIQEIKQTYAKIVHENYKDAHQGAVNVQQKVNVFLADPTEANFTAIKTAWLDARVAYGQTEAYRFYGGPIDDEDGPEGLINAWPLDEVYIDDIIDDSVNYPTLDVALITSLNEQGGEANISTGWHAIEYLLWGQDFNASGPGARPYTDYTTNGLYERRAAYLSAASSLLVTNLQSMLDEWDPNGVSNYRSAFLAMDDNTALSYMLQGIGFLAKGELAGERLSVAYDSQLQEDEHSCFSDNTHVDIRQNMQGIMNVYTGTYETANGSIVSGASINDLVHEKDAALADEIHALMDECRTACNAIQAPFDQEILAGNTAGRERVNLTITKLRELGDKLSEAAGVLGVSITIE